MLAIVRIERGYRDEDAALLRQEDHRRADANVHSLRKAFADRDLAFLVRAPPCAHVHLRARRYGVRPGEADGLKQMTRDLLLLQLIAGFAVDFSKSSGHDWKPLHRAMHPRLLRDQRRNAIELICRD